MPGTQYITCASMDQQSRVSILFQYLLGSEFISCSQMNQEGQSTLSPLHTHTQSHTHTHTNNLLGTTVDSVHHI